MSVPAFEGRAFRQELDATQSMPGPHGLGFVIERVDAPSQMGTHRDALNHLHRGRLGDQRRRPSERQVVPPGRLARILGVMLDEAEFLSPHGLRALSAGHRTEPFSVDLAGMQYSVDYEPAASTTDLFGGNSDWRGPVWFPVTHLLIDAVERFARFYVSVECPAGSGRQHTLGEVADELWRRMIATFLDGPDDRHPAFRSAQELQCDPEVHDRLLFDEYFHGDGAAGLGASHQAGWTGLVADLITQRGRSS